MKKDIHPKYNTDAVVTCGCGNTFTIGSTEESIRVEICAACHPFYTGKQKLVDTAGRVDKFKARVEAARKIQEAAAQKAATKAEPKPKADKADETAAKKATTKTKK